MNDKNKTFLICHRGALGDFILTWPAIHVLKKHFPDHKFFGLGRPEYMKLAVKLGILEEYRDADSAIMQDFLENGLIPQKLGNPGKGVLWLKDARKTSELLKKNSNCNFAPIEPFPEEKIHVAKFHVREISKYFNFNETIDLLSLTYDTELQSNSTAAECRCYNKNPAVAAALCCRVPSPKNATRPEHSFSPKDTILIHPGSGSSKKNYSPEFYLEVAKFAEAHFKKDVKFILGPVETEKNMGMFFPAEKTIAPENPSALADVLGGADLYIGNDSGASHLSGALGTPTVALYKNTDPEIWGVVGRKVKYIEGTDESQVLEKINIFFNSGNIFNLFVSN